MAPDFCLPPGWSLAVATVTGPTVGFNGMLDGLSSTSSSQEFLLRAVAPLAVAYFVGAFLSTLLGAVDSTFRFVFSTRLHQTRTTRPCTSHDSHSITVNVRLTYCA